MTRAKRQAAKDRMAKFLAAHPNYYRSNERREYYRLYQQRRRKDPALQLAYAARNWAGDQIREGRIKRQPCQNCGAKRAEAHHPDYTKPREIIWLCKKCHEAIHHPLEPSESDSLLGSPHSPTTSSPGL